MQRATRHGASSESAPRQGERADAAHHKGLWARVANVILGCWLFASAFLLPHTPGSGGNTWIVGMLIVIFGLWSIWAPVVRRMNTACAVYLLGTVAAFPHVAGATRMHNLLVACAVLALSLVPSRPLPTRAYIDASAMR